MNTAIRTTTARKAMRVATVFAGAAGLAVAFGPGALAAPSHAPVQGHPARANGKPQVVAGEVLYGSIRSAGCTTNEWLHIQYSSTFRTLCKAFGYAGEMVPSSSPLHMEAQCGGNNYGAIFYQSGLEPITYGPGKTYRTFSTPFPKVSAVSISKWKGTDKCAWPR
jgi:hypothetical protein